MHPGVVELVKGQFRSVPDTLARPQWLRRGIRRRTTSADRSGRREQRAVVRRKTPLAVVSVAPDAVADSPNPTENKDTLCRNVLIYGHCRYEDQGCAFNHDQNKSSSPQAD